MQFEDFKESDVYNYEGNCLVWGKNTSIGLVIEDSDDDTILTKHIDKINQQLDFIQNNKNKIVDFLVENEFLELADEWISSGEEADDYTEEKECYLDESGKKVYLPITPEDFAESISFESINFSFDDEGMLTETYIMCDPDYFAGHVICFDIEPDGSFSENSIAG